MVLLKKESVCDPITVHRVPRHTADDVNKQIHRQTEHNVARLADAPPEAIEQRLAELDREWDIERGARGQRSRRLADRPGTGSNRGS